MPDQITPRQFRGARAMLGWSMLDLAKASGVSVLIVRRAERGVTERASPVASQPIRAALEAAGVGFLSDEGEGEGVRVHPL